MENVMAEKQRVLSHEVQSGNATMRVELKIDGEELTVSATASTAYFATFVSR
jgi:hypothetical protein